MRGAWFRIGWAGALILGSATGVLMAVLALTERLYLSPLGAADIDASVVVFAAHTDTGRSRELTSYAVFAEWRQRATSFAILSGYRTTFANIVGQHEPERLRAALVAGQFFGATGATVPLGRDFHDDDYVAPGPVCVLSDALWRRRFQADPAVIGSSVRLEISGSQSNTFTVVGVAPRGHRYPNQADIWLPYIPTQASSTNYSGQWFGVVGRLRLAGTVEQAHAELTNVMEDVQLAHPRTQPSHVANVVPLRDVLTADHRTLVAGLMLASVLLWLSAVATVGSFLTAPSLRTRHDVAIRVSLGVRRRTLLIDNLISGVLHGAAALLVAVPVSMLTLQLFETFLTAALTSADDMSVTFPVSVVALVTLVATYTSILLVLTAHTLRAIDAHGVRIWTSGRLAGAAHVRVRSALVIAQIALTVVAMVLAAGILTRLASIERVDLGFSGDDLLTVRVELPSARYNDTQVLGFTRAALEQLQRLPGIDGVAGASDEPLFGQSPNPEFTLHLENRPLAPDERTPVLVNGVTRDYFALLRIPVLTGETAALDGDGLTAFVNTSFAQRFYAGQTPVGRRFRFGGNNGPWWTIVGIVADTRNDGPLMPPKATVYMNGARFGKSGMTLFAKVSDGGDRSLPAMRTTLATLDPELPIGRIAPANILIRQRFADVWLASRGLLAVSATALILAMLGLVGVQLTLAMELRPEIALRCAMGASPLDIVRFWGTKMVPLVVLGVSAGAIGGVLAAQAVAVYAAFDHPRPVVVTLIASAVALVALAVSIGPMAAAVRTDPALTLRSQ